ncbi:MAG TPA: DUF2249 domain-containing protein [Gammaproteobacteria bacterium]|nr:DUF2249 domain-containing protein [Gammaproteobacteria bacterium]
MERYLDVSRLEPPEPLESILSSITTLGPGQFLRVYHSREPFPLYSLLEQQGFDWRSCSDEQDMYHVFIWHVGDDVAMNRVERALSGCNKT